MNETAIDRIRFDERGLIPAIVQDHASGEVLTLAYMSRESLLWTLEHGETCFWSRERQSLWHKGESSGHTQKVREIRYDCDADTLLVRVEPKGPACHTGRYSCFFNILRGGEEKLSSLGETLGWLARVISQRRAERPAGSYTVKLLEGGIDCILKKIAEEAGEVMIAAKNRDRAGIAWEVADLLYHTLVLLEAEGVSTSQVALELEKRAGKGGGQDRSAGAEAAAP